LSTSRREVALSGGAEHVEHVDRDVQGRGGRYRGRDRRQGASDCRPWVLDGARAVILGACVAGGKFLLWPVARLGACRSHRGRSWVDGFKGVGLARDDMGVDYDPLKVELVRATGVGIGSWGMYGPWFDCGLAGGRFTDKCIYVAEHIGSIPKPGTRFDCGRGHGVSLCVGRGLSVWLTRI
jgi:hypothetical protein